MTLWSIRRMTRAAFLAAILMEPAMAGATADTWLDTWGASPDSVGPALKAQSIRQIIRTSTDGSALRLRFSNLLGTTPLTIGPVHVAASESGSAIRPQTDHAVTFGGHSSVTIAKGKDVLSDAVGFPVQALEDLAVTLYLPAGATAPTIHAAGMETAFFVAGDATAATSFPSRAQTDDSRYFLTDVEVNAATRAEVMVVVGDSITDGIGSTEDKNSRWTDILAARLHASPVVASIGVVNSGIAGNRILNDGARPFVGPSALSRFDRDALDKPGARWVMLFEGIGDIIADDVLTSTSQHVSTSQIIEGMKTLVARAHARNIKVWGATLMPYEGAVLPSRDGTARPLYTGSGEAKRQLVNAWIRDSGTFDAVVDFDLVTRDPTHPSQLLPAFDSGDHLHPNDTGYEAIATSIDPRWLAAGK